MTSRKKNILIADDSETFVMYLSILLKRLGFDVIPAENGLEALKLTKVMEPSLVLLDINMPVMDGITALRLMKGDKRTAEIPVVIISTDSKKETMEECEKLGCAGYITKPVLIDKIHKALQECLYPVTGFKRKHIRTTISKKVSLSYAGACYELYAISISEGGMYILKKDPFPVGSEVKVTFQISEDKSLCMDAVVIYVKGVFGDLFKTPPGMALEFRNLTHDDSLLLNNYVKKLIAEDIIDSQEEPIIDPDQIGS
jgi:CheY-like chemotaxis protein